MKIQVLDIPQPLFLIGSILFDESFLALAIENQERSMAETVECIKKHARGESEFHGPTDPEVYKLAATIVSSHTLTNGTSIQIATDTTRRRTTIMTLLKRREGS